MKRGHFQNAKMNAKQTHPLGDAIFLSFFFQSLNILKIYSFCIFCGKTLKCLTFPLSKTKFREMLRDVGENSGDNICNLKEREFGGALSR